MDKTVFKKSPVDRALEIVSAVWPAVNFYPLVVCSDLPDQIPVPFGRHGETDDGGGRRAIWGVPFASLFCYVVLTVLRRFPQIHNFPFKIEPENLTAAWRSSIRMLRYVEALLWAMSACFDAAVSLATVGRRALDTEITTGRCRDSSFCLSSPWFVR